MGDGIDERLRQAQEGGRRITEQTAVPRCIGLVIALPTAYGAVAASIVHATEVHTGRHLVEDELRVWMRAGSRRPRPPWIGVVLPVIEADPICPTCDGTGNVAPVQVTGPAQGKYEPIRACPTCNGTGSVRPS